MYISIYGLENTSIFGWVFEKFILMILN